MAIILSGVEIKKQMIMKIEVIKPQEEVKWNFPCKGIGNKTDLVVGFDRYGSGCVLEKGQTNYNLYLYSEFWAMDTFTPLKEEKAKGNNYDWSSPKFPILAKIEEDEIFMIEEAEGVNDLLLLTTFNHKHHFICQDTTAFESKEDMTEWLKSLEILPQGTEIKITF